MSEPAFNIENAQTILRKLFGNKQPEASPVAPVAQSASNQQILEFGPTQDDPTYSAFEQNFRVFLDTTYKRNSTGRHPSYQKPSDEEYWGARSQYAYMLDRRNTYGFEDLKFGTPVYLPYRQEDEDNAVWSDFIGEYGYTPQNAQEFETHQKVYGAKKTKDAYGLLDLKYQTGDSLKPNESWRNLEFDYDPNDYTDMQRAAAGLPPRAYTDKYNKDDSEDVARLKGGQYPKYYDNTSNALNEFSDLQTTVLQMAARNEIHSADDIMNLYDQGVKSGKYKYLKSIDDYIAAYNKAVPEGGYSTYDKLTGNTKKAPWQHVDLDLLKEAGLTVSTDAAGMMNSAWLQDLANKGIEDQKQKYGGSSNTSDIFGQIGGWFEETPYEKEIRERGGALPLSATGGQGNTFRENKSKVVDTYTKTLDDPVRQFVVSDAKTGASGHTPHMEDLLYQEVQKLLDEGYGIDHINPNGITGFTSPDSAEIRKAILMESPDEKQRADNLYGWAKMLKLDPSEYPQNDDELEKVFLAQATTVDPNVAARGSEDAENPVNKIKSDLTPQDVEYIRSQNYDAIKNRNFDFTTLKVRGKNYTMEQIGRAMFTSDEIDIVNYYDGLGDKATAQKLTDYYINQHLVEFGTVKAELAAESSSTVTKIGSSVTSFAPAIVYFLESLYNGITGKGPQESVSSLSLRAANAFEKSLVGDIKDPTWQFVAQAGLSIAQNAPLLLTGPAAPYIMAASSAGQAALGAKDRGASGWQQIAESVAYGVAEYVGEKVSLGGLMKILNMGKKGALGFVMNVGKQMATEFTEESATEVMQILSDVAVMGDKSQIEQYLRDYIKAHPDKSRTDAIWSTVVQSINQVLYAGGQGAISGGVLGATASTISQFNDWVTRQGGKPGEMPGNEATGGGGIPEQGNVAQEAPQSTETVPATVPLAENTVPIQQKAVAPVQQKAAAPAASKNVTASAPQTTTAPAIETKRAAKITGTDTFKPQRDVEVKGVGDFALSEKEGDLTPMQEELLSDLADPESRKRIETTLGEYRDELNQEIESTLQYMNDTKGRGVEIINNAEAGITRRESRNEQWYRELFAETGRTPSQKRMRQAAVEMMMDENSDLYVPGFADKFNAYREARELLDKVKGKGNIVSVERTQEGDYKVSYGVVGKGTAPASAPVRPTGEYTPDVQTRAAAAGYGTDPKNLVDSYIDLKNEANKLASPKAKSIAKEAQAELAKIMNFLRERTDALPLDPATEGWLDTMIDASEGKLKKLVRVLQDEVQAVKEKTKADLKKLRTEKNAKLDAAEQKRQIDVAAAKSRVAERMEKKLAALETKRRADLSKLREQKNISAEWKHTASAVKDLRRQFDGKDSRPLPDGYADFVGETLQGLERTKGKNNAADGVANIGKFEKWLNGLDEAALDEAGIDTEDKARLQGWISEVKDKNIREMDLYQHQALGKLVRRMKHLSSSYYRFFGRRKHLEMQVVRDETVAMLDKTEKSKPFEQQRETNLLKRVTDRYWGYQALKPYVAVKYILHDASDSNAKHILADDLRQADHDGADMNMKDLTAKRDVFGMAKVSAWSGKAAPKTDFALENGGGVALTNAEQLFVWLNTHNDFNRDAMLNGVRFEKTGIEVTPTENDIDTIAQRVESTPELKGVGEKFLDRFNNEFKVRANSTSRQLYGYDIATIENYVPVQRVDDARATHFQPVGKTLESFSWTKPRSGSKAAVRGWDIFEMYDRMALETAQYAAYAVPVKNAQRLIGNGAVRTKVIEKRGPLAFDYYKRLLGDVAERGQQTPDTTGNVFDAARRNAQASIMASPWVMANQYAQVPAMFSYIKGRYAIKGLKLKIPKGDLAAMKAYAPEIYARRLFGGMTEAAELKSIVGDNPGMIAKVRELATKGVGFNDTVTVNFAWESAKAQIKAEHPDLNGETFWEKVGELASDAIEETQPSHGLFTRSLFENTKTPLERLLFMFSGGPNAIWNMSADAIAEFRWGGAEGRKKAGKLLGGIVASQVAFGLIAAIRKGVTDNDADEIAGEAGTQILLAFLTVPYAFNIPISYLQGFDTRLQGIDQMQKVISAAMGIVNMKPVEYAASDTPADKARKDAEQSSKVWGKYRTILIQISSTFGIPLNQLERDVVKPVLKMASEKAYNDYLKFFGQDATYSADFKAAAPENPNWGNTEKARGILRGWIEAKGRDSVRQSIHQSDWYKGLTPAQKAYWDNLLNTLR